MLFRNPLWLYVSQVGARNLAVLDGVYAFVGSVVYTLVVVGRLFTEELAMLTVFSTRYAIALTTLATSLPGIALACQVAGAILGADRRRLMVPPMPGPP
jgi:hypothetical protein